jgi:hypothetical protein
LIYNENWDLVLDLEMKSRYGKEYLEYRDLLLQDIALEKHIMRRSTQDDLKQPAILMFNGFERSNPVIELGGITVIKGYAGSHKSRLINNMILALIRDNRSVNNGKQFLERKKTNIHVVHSDTEKHTNYALPEAIKNIKIGAGVGNEALALPNFNVSGLNRFDSGSRFPLLKMRLRMLRIAKPKSIIVCFLDLVSDFLYNTNDIETSKALVQDISSFADIEDICFVLSNHTNHKQSAANDKSAGHLGTEMEKKATVVIKIMTEPKKNLIWIEFDKLRNIKPDNEKHYFKVNQQTLLLELIETPPIEELSSPNNGKEKIDWSNHNIENYFIILLDAVFRENEFFASKGNLREKIWEGAEDSKDVMPIMLKHINRFLNDLYDGKQIQGFKLDCSNKKKICLVKPDKSTKVSSNGKTNGDKLFEADKNEGGENDSI